MPFVVLLVPFFAIIAAFVLIGLSQVHSAQHGTSGIRGFLDAAISNSFVGQLYGLSVKAARSLVSKYAASHLKMLTGFLYGMASLWKQQFTATRRFAGATDRLAHTLDRAIPRVAHKAAAPALARAKVADRHATRALGLEHSTAKELHRFRATTRARLKADAHAIDVTIPRDIGALRKRTRAVEDAQAKDRGAIADIEHGAADTWDWIKSHPLSSVTGLFAGAVVVALSRLGYGFLRCRNWRNVGKRITCGMGSWIGALLDLIATFALALLGALNPDVLARVTVRAVDEIEPMLDRVLATTTNEKQIEKDVERLVSWLGLG